MQRSSTLQIWASCSMQLLVPPMCFLFQAGGASMRRWAHQLISLAFAGSTFRVVILEGLQALNTALVGAQISSKALQDAVDCLVRAVD